MDVYEKIKNYDVIRKKINKKLGCVAAFFLLLQPLNIYFILFPTFNLFCLVIALDVPILFLLYKLEKNKAISSNELIELLRKQGNKGTP